MYLSQSLRQSHVLRQSITLPDPVTWSAVNACEEDSKHGFVFPLTHLRHQIKGFNHYRHDEKMESIDFANEMFRYDYGVRNADADDDDDGEGDAKAPAYFRIPLMRNSNINRDEIAEEISEEEYRRAKFIVENVGQLERIARAVPYHELLTNVRNHLQYEYQIDLKDVALVSIDRGGRFPAEILCRALDVKDRHSLKVDQSYGELDEDMLEHFAQTGALKGKHVLFVDSTVDSGRQIEALIPYFDNEEWKQKLGFTDWSIVGSNESGETLYKHLNVNWGVDPDATFEDNPVLMGVDYDPESRTKVVDVTNPASQKIREVFFAVTEGYIFDTDNSSIDELMEAEEWKEENDKFPASISEQVRYFCELVSTASEDDEYKEYEVNLGNLPLPEREKIKDKKVLLIGNSRVRDLDKDQSAAIVDSFDLSSCQFLAGTESGNPGRFLDALYEIPASRPAKNVHNMWKTYDMSSTPDEECGEIRRQMAKDGDCTLALGGNIGTFNEILLSLKQGKPTFVIEGWGWNADRINVFDQLRTHKNLHICKTVQEALEQIREL